MHGANREVAFFGEHRRLLEARGNACVAVDSSRELRPALLSASADKGSVPDVSSAVSLGSRPGAICRVAVPKPLARRMGLARVPPHSTHREYRGRLQP